MHEKSLIAGFIYAWDIIDQASLCPKKAKHECNWQEHLIIPKLFGNCFYHARLYISWDENLLYPFVISAEVLKIKERHVRISANVSLKLFLRSFTARSQKAGEIGECLILGGDRYAIWPRNYSILPVQLSLDISRAAASLGGTDSVRLQLLNENLLTWMLTTSVLTRK